jgi:hypothetical protein
MPRRRPLPRLGLALHIPVGATAPRDATSNAFVAFSNVERWGHPKKCSLLTSTMLGYVKSMWSSVLGSFSTSSSTSCVEKLEKPQKFPFVQERKSLTCRG